MTACPARDPETGQPCLKQDGELRDGIHVHTSESSAWVDDEPGDNGAHGITCTCWGCLGDDARDADRETETP